jgi:hypothetical protein
MRVIAFVALLPIIAFADSPSFCAQDVIAVDWSTFSCDKAAQKMRMYCKDMASCDEASFHWAICNRRDFDRDEDNMPCEGVCPVVEGGRK